MKHTFHGIDLDYRPVSYFWPLSLATHLLATVKGAERRKYIQALIDQGKLDELEDVIAKSRLAPEEREYTGRIHPWFMGGEYLPDHRPSEVEIARITLASTTQDVVSVRARKGRGRIRYRVVDEYGGDTLSGRNERTSIRPLTLGQLVAFLDGAWSVREVVAMNDMEVDSEQMKWFVTVSSPFYPEIGAYFGRRFEDWGEEYRRLNDPGEDVPTGVVNP